jgi:voltage-gated sodium channel
MKLISQLILAMTIFLCVCIFSELALDNIEQEYSVLSNFFYGLNFFLLTFFITEIVLKTFAYGFAFYSDFINCFDSSIVIVSYVMLILNLKLKVLGLLRVLRLIKVIVGMKKVVDEKRAR